MRLWAEQSQSYSHGVEQPVGVLFVCLGNICRSPMAEAVFRSLVEKKGLASRFEISSCGTGDWNVGKPPHPGTRRILDELGISYEGMRAKVYDAPTILSYDYIVAMDRSNRADLQTMGVPGQRIHLLTDFIPGLEGSDVPDPYYDGRFRYVYELVDKGTQGLLKAIVQQRGWDLTL